MIATTDQEKKAGNHDLFRVTDKAAAGMADWTANHPQFDGNRQIDPPTWSVTGAAPKPASIEEKPESCYEIRFPASDRFLRKLKRAQTICSRHPGLEAVLEKALDELLERHDPEKREARRNKRKTARRDRSRPVPAKEDLSGKRTPESDDGGNRSRPDHAPMKPNRSSGHSRIEKPNRRSRHIPAAIRDAVFKRDNGRCTYVGRNGVRCGATIHLQIDHIRPFCQGGKHTIDNLRLLCGKHNRLAARLI